MNKPDHTEVAKWYKKIKWINACIDLYEIAKKKWWFIYGVALVALLIIAIWLDYKYKMFGSDENIANIISGLNGIIFNFVLFGIILKVYERNKDKKDRIENLQDELDDYKYWEGEESTYRRIGIINRLILAGVKEINLKRHTFKQGKFIDINLNELKFDNIRFYSCKFQRGTIDKDIRSCKFNQCVISGLKFENSILTITDFNECQLDNVEFNSVKFSWTDFEKCQVRNSVFKNCTLEASFKDCTVYGESTSFEGCNFKEAELDGMLFPFLRRDELTNKFNEWIGKDQTKEYILDKYSIINLDDPSPYEVTFVPIGTPQPYKKPSPGCSLRKIPKGVQRNNTFD